MTGPKLLLARAVIIGLTAMFSSCVENSKTCFFEEVAPPRQRPKDVWVFRSVLDGKPRMLSIGLNENMWVAYSTETGSLYKAWDGHVKLAGGVYGRGGGQPVSQGTSFLQEPDGNPWVVVRDGSEIAPKIVYKGHGLVDGRVTLTYELHYDGEQIAIEEQPEFYDLGNEKVGFERVFKTSGTPFGDRVGLKINLRSVVSPADYQTDGELVIASTNSERIDDRDFREISGTLYLRADNFTSLALQLTPKPATTIKEVLQTEETITVSMFERNGCNTCHSQTENMVGPSFRSVARRYENIPSNVEALTTRVIKGGSGNWGDAAMIPHSEVPEHEIKRMVSYVLKMDVREEARVAELMPDSKYPFRYRKLGKAAVDKDTEMPGVAVNIYQLDFQLYGFPQIREKTMPRETGVINMLHAYPADFETKLGRYTQNFAIQARGYLNIKQEGHFQFRLTSNDGSRIFINDEKKVETVGNWSDVQAEDTVYLKAGKHPFIYEYYDRGGPKKFSMQWRRNGNEAFSVVPPEVFTFRNADLKDVEPFAFTVAVEKKPVPGDGTALDKLHPSFDLTQARPDSFQPKVSGLDFMSDGRLVVSTWDSLGAVYILDGVQGEDPNGIKVKRVGAGLAEPLGLKVVNDEIYVLQKQELTKLVDLDGDEIADEYQNFCNSWSATNNHHEFAFGLVYKDGYFYGTLSLAIEGPGPSAPIQAPDRGKAFKISIKDGSITYPAHGLRTPNGIGFGVDNEIFIADNQGDWLPANKIIHLKQGAFYGNRSSLSAGEEKAEEPPVVYLEHDKVGNSPSQPATLNVGPYQNQMIHGDVTHGGIKRVFAEKVNGSYQGVVFRFSQGLEAGVNRLVWGPDGSLYVGGIGNGGNWGQYGKLRYGLQKLTYNRKPVFEMLAVRAKPTGVEIEFTEPLKEGAGSSETDYTIKQWWYNPTANYGGPNMDVDLLEIRQIRISADRKRVMLELPGMKEGHVVYIRLNRDSVVSSENRHLWTTEAWYTMNNIPERSGR